MASSKDHGSWRRDSAAHSGKANMTSMGWSSMQAVDSGTYKWGLEAMVDTAKRPVKHFSITAEDGKIRRITWGNYVID